jgi:hypothetical protein
VAFIHALGQESGARNVILYTAARKSVPPVSSRLPTPD